MYLDKRPWYKKLPGILFGWISPEFIVIMLLVAALGSVITAAIVESNKVSSYEGVTIEWQDKSCNVADFKNGDPIMIYVDEDGNFVRFILEFEELESLAEEQGVKP